MKSQDKCKHKETTDWIYQIYSVEEPSYVIRCLNCNKIIKKILKKDLTSKQNFYIL